MINLISTQRRTVWLGALLLLLTTIPISTTLAAGGETPTSAVVIETEAQSGSLEPFEAEWFVFTATDDVEQSLTLTVTPDEATVVQFVQLQLFTEAEVDNYQPGDSSGMSSFGSSQAVIDEEDNRNKVVGSAAVTAGERYYVQLLNESDFAIEYSLILDAITPVIDEEAAPIVEEIVEEIVEVVEEAVETVAPPEAPAALGSNSPDSATYINDGLTRGRLKPNSTYWYRFNHDEYQSDKYKTQDITMYITPDDGFRRHRVNFKVYQANELSKGHFGAGMQTEREDDFNVAGYAWRGVVPYGEYLVAIENGTDVEIDYWLYDGDIYSPLLGPLPEPEPPRVFAPGAAPTSSFPLESGLNKGKLAAGEEVWYRMMETNFLNPSQSPRAVTMIVTPDDGNRIRDITFDVFSAGGARLWSPGDNSRIDNIGAGTVVYRDDNIETGERFWQGWVIDNNLYYVQLRNNSDVDIDYWLYDGDVYRPELGPPAMDAKEMEPVVPGTAPTEPLDLGNQLIMDKLDPGTERWYTFSRGEPDDRGNIRTPFTLIFTPDDGNRIRKVNFELFDSYGIRDWAPDNRFNIVPFGKGNTVSRDGNPLTGELVWLGHVVANNRYLLRVVNESEVVIDYWLFPSDEIPSTLPSPSE